MREASGVVKSGTQRKFAAAQRIVGFLGSC
jgi:hypothetical protein